MFDKETLNNLQTWTAHSRSAGTVHVCIPVPVMEEVIEYLKTANVLEEEAKSMLTKLSQK